MVGQLYTSYVSRASHYSFTRPTRTFTIMKYPFSKHSNIIELAPRESYNDLKNMRCTFEGFKNLYKAEMKAESSIDAMDQIYLLLEDGFDVVLCCCEKNRKECHRAVLGEIIAKRFDIEVKEL